MRKRLLLSCLCCLAPGAAAAARTHTVIPKDTLWDLAARYYKNPFQWPRIARANPPPGVKDPHWIYPGQLLVIPDLEPPAAQAAAAPAPSPAPPPAVPSSAPAAPPPPRKAAGEEAAQNSLSTRLPKGLVGQPPSSVRFKAPPGWKADGMVAEVWEEALAAQGDRVQVRLYAQTPPAAGTRYGVFRRAAPAEEDQDQKSLYLVRVGTLELESGAPGRARKALVLDSSDAIQSKDLLRREE